MKEVTSLESRVKRNKTRLLVFGIRISFTPWLQPGVKAASGISNRFNGFPGRRMQTVETVPPL